MKRRKLVLLLVEAAVLMGTIAGTTSLSADEKTTFAASVQEFCERINESRKKTAYKDASRELDAIRQQAFPKTN